MANGRTISDADRMLAARMMNEGEKTVSDADVIEALGISMSNPTGTETDNYDRSISARVLKMATPEQKAMARDQLGVPEDMNMGGMMRDELGYMGGGMSYSKRGPVKYSKGGAIKGKNFKGSY
tara:strand:+ start:288 stop:656 length:369 start_codon:yes stop_codon:yes gene_type:complete